MEIVNFTPWTALAGGALIGLAASVLALGSGRIAGISGILGRLFPPYAGTDPLGAACFVLGLLASPLLYAAATGAPFAQSVSSNTSLMAVAGLHVGYGTTLGSGCTSGHGACGIARLSPRSIAATCIFMATAFITVFVMRHLIGG